MATNLTGATNFAKIALSIAYAAEKALDMSTPDDKGSLSIKETLTFGTGNSASDMLWHDRRILAASATDSLDLAGVLTNFTGATVTFAKVHCILVHNRSDEALTTAAHGVTHTATAAVLDVGAPANGALILKVVGDLITLAAGDWVVVFSKAGKTIAAGTGDLFDLVETAALEAAYDIIVLGESA
ncbi:MAG TPA: hypothetical protein VMX12_01375 [Acidimicrobiia bacterium]|nr:hypothetical protein [Acidimicrobiia bacterium]